MTVLVTGANGLLGSHLVRGLLKQGATVRALVRSTSDVRSLAGLPIEMVHGDVRDPHSLQRAAEGCTQLFHTAAVFSYWGYSRDEMLETATEGARNTLHAAKSAGVERVILTASSSVLGPNWSPRSLTEEDGSDLEGTLA